MSLPTPRLRMFAGPNGSGKSTIKEVIPPAWLGVYVNPDEIEKAIRRDRALALTDYAIQVQPGQIEQFLKSSTLLSKTDLSRHIVLLDTEDSAINIERVRQRVAAGGHAVAADKIVSRYERSLDLLLSAVECADRAYIFDNSGHERLWVAEASLGLELEMKCEQMPNWFKTRLWDRFDGEDNAMPSDHL